jgi:thymidine kinase
MKTKGSLEIVCGSMFSGKSEELIRRLRRSELAKQKIAAFKHSLDARKTIHYVISHNGTKISALTANEAAIILQQVAPEVEVVGIDEVQFFDQQIINVILELVNQGKRVIAAGLDMDFRGVPFGPMPTLLALADKILKLHAICSVCGQDAQFTQRIINGAPAKFNDPIILIGAEECYQARCRNCFEIDQHLIL